MEEGAALSAERKREGLGLGWVGKAALDGLKCILVV